MISAIIASISLITVLSVTAAIVYQGNNLQKDYDAKLHTIVDQVSNSQYYDAATSQLNNQNIMDVRNTYESKSDLAKGVTTQELASTSIKSNKASLNTLNTTTSETRDFSANNANINNLTTNYSKNNILTAQNATINNLTTTSSKNDYVSANNIDLNGSLKFPSGYSLSTQNGAMSVLAPTNFNILSSDKKPKLNLDTKTNDLILGDIQITQQNSSLNLGYLDTQNNLLPVLEADKKNSMGIGTKANQLQIGPHSHFPYFDQHTYIRPGQDGKDVNIGDQLTNYVNIGNQKGKINLNAPTNTQYPLNLNTASISYNKSIDGPQISGVKGGALGTTDGQNLIQWNNKGEVQIGPHSHFPYADQNTYIRPGADGKDIYIGDYWTNNVKLGQATTNIDVQGSLNLNNRPLVFGPSTTKTSGVGYFDPNASFGGFGPSGPVMYGANGGGLGTTSTGPRTALNWNSDAQVETNKIRFSQKWSEFPDQNSDQSEISNDTHDYKQLMIVGNKSGGGVRKVGVWDQLDVNGILNVNGPTNLNGTLNMNSDFTAPMVGRPSNSTDWFRINGDNGNNPKQPGTALYNGLAINDGGGLDVGQWNKQPQGQLHADYIRSRGDIQTDANLNLFAGKAAISKAPGPGSWNSISKQNDMVITNVNTDLKGGNAPDNGITLAPWNGQGGLRAHGGGVDVNGETHLNGNLVINSGATVHQNNHTIHNTGRQHVYAGEDLFLLTKGQTHVGKGWGATGNLDVEGDLTSTTVGRPVGATDWFRINGNNGNNKNQPGTALYNGLAINDGGGLDVGQWNKQPQGQLHADYIRSRGDIQTDKNLNLFAGKAAIVKAPGPGSWNPISKQNDLVITNVQTDLKGTNTPDNGITLAPWNGQGGLRAHGGGVDVNGSLKVRYPTIGDWTDQAAIVAYSANGQMGPSFGGPDNWSHFPYLDGNTYIRPGKTNGNIMIGDAGNANVYLGGNGGTTNFIGDSALNDKMMHIRGINDPNHGLKYTGGTADGPRLFGCQGGQLGTQCGGEKTALSWDNNGNITVPGRLNVSNGPLCIGPPNNQWCFTPSGNGNWLDIQRNGATDGANQGSFHLSQDGNLYLNRSSYPGWVADNIANVNSRIA